MIAAILPSGHLTLEQLQGLFEALPVDLTFVDADDRVFSRTRAILGRRVQHCHPPKSVDVVERIQETLVGLAPTFSKLKNPILRRTVARERPEQDIL